MSGRHASVVQPSLYLAEFSDAVTHTPCFCTEEWSR